MIQECQHSHGGNSGHVLLECAHNVDHVFVFISLFKQDSQGDVCDMYLQQTSKDNEHIVMTTLTTSEHWDISRLCWCWMCLSRSGAYLNNGIYFLTMWRARIAKLSKMAAWSSLEGSISACN